MPAFTLVELMVVIAIISVLLGLVAPALSSARRAARVLLSVNNQRSAVSGVTFYATDCRDRFPDSVATLGTGDRWTWREPMVLIGFQERSPLVHRSVSAYLRDYVEDGATMFCPCSPSAYRFAEAAWAAGDAWNHPNPDTGSVDPLFGDYCLYWNYVGYLPGGTRPFVGPRTTSGTRGQSDLLISDYFGYGHWRNELTYGTRNAYGSCEKIPGGDVTAGTSVACDFWSLAAPDDAATRESLELRFKAGFVDGHVQAFGPGDVMPMKVAMTPDGGVAYPDNIGPAGTIYIPREQR